MCPVRTVTHVSGRSFVSGMADRLADLVDPKNDPVGLQLDKETCRSAFAGIRFCLISFVIFTIDSKPAVFVASDARGPPLIELIFPLYDLSLR